MSHAGRFVWRELITDEPSQVAGFYAQLFGWTANEIDMGTPYTMLHHPQLNEDVGGATAPAMAGVPSHWLDYITVDDVDEAVAEVPTLGGEILVAPRDIPPGRFAIIRDPAGAALAIFKSATPGASDTDRRPPTGTFCWSQLMSDQLDHVTSFYTTLFGWTAVSRDDGSVWFMQGDAPRASAMPKPADMPAPNHWLQYVSVPETDAAFAKAQALGATAMVPPSDIPGMGRFAVLADPAGAAFALWTDVQG